MLCGQGEVKIQKLKVKIEMQNAKFKTDLKDRCYKFSLQIISTVSDLPNKRTAWIIADQLIRSATSIGANLVEARASSSRREYKKFYEIALKSANESVYWLSLLKDSGLAQTYVINPLIGEAIELANMLGAGVLKLKSKN